MIFNGIPFKNTSELITGKVNTDLYFNGHLEFQILYTERRSCIIMKTLFHMYPEIDLKNFEVPENFNWGLDWIDYLGKEKEDGKALIFRHEGRTSVYTFGEISDLSTRMAGYLETKEIKKGDRVILMMGNVPFLWISFVALTKIGAVVIPTATVMTEKDLRYRIEKSGACGIITDGQNAGKLNSDLYGRMKVRAIGFGSTDLEGWDCMDEKSLIKLSQYKMDGTGSKNLLAEND